MSATNHTANLELPVFVGDDKPAWLTDWNGAMTTIDGAVGSAQTDISGLSANVSTQGGQISSLNTTVGQHTTSINTLTDATSHNAGDINTINSLIGNGTPTTTDQTIIGAINELHADQGDLDDLQTTDKSSIVAAVNEISAGGSGAKIVRIRVSGDGVKTVAAIIQDVAAAYLTHVATLATNIRSMLLCGNLGSAVTFRDVPRNNSAAHITAQGSGVYIPSATSGGQMISITFSDTSSSYYGSSGDASTTYDLGAGICVQGATYEVITLECEFEQI